MSYLQQYKAGSTLFRTLSEGRMRVRSLHNRFRFACPAPDSIVSIHDQKETDFYVKKGEASSFAFPRGQIIPEPARPILEIEKEICFPETFVLRIPDGRVLGDGTVVTPQNRIVSESTIDFHRKQDFHWLLSERRVPAKERFDGRLAVITSPGSDNYFHWTLDSLPRLSLLRGMESEIDGYYIDCSSRFHREWLDMLQIPAEKIVAASPKRHLEARELIVPSFEGLPGLPSPRGLKFVRSFMPPENSQGKRIYISRAGARRRRIVNEAEIMPILKENGFEVVHPGQMTVKEQMQMFASAAVIVSPHGAELTNLTYCTSGTKVVELLSPYYLNPCFRNLSALLNLEHTALIGKGGRQIISKQLNAHHVWANIRVDSELFGALLSNVLETGRTTEYGNLEF